MNNNQQTPQQFVFQTLKNLMVKIHRLLEDLDKEHKILENKLDSTGNRLNSYIKENENYRQELLRELNSLKKSLEQTIQKLEEIEDYIAQTEMKISISKRILGFLTTFPAKLVGFCAAVTAIVLFFAKYINP